MDGAQIITLSELQSSQNSQRYTHAVRPREQGNGQQNEGESVEGIFSTVYGAPQQEIHDHEHSSSDEAPPKPKYGKKTRGRVKIKMQFINNKLRRYTTFSKRKTGIMKKAYELSTLTGTQVMLLVASETGHVYTFATKKLQPMITSESGKALIQTCLNSPETSSITQHDLDNDRRMNPNGFEETELCYAVAEDEESEASREVHEVMLNGAVQGEGQTNQLPVSSSSSNSINGNTFNINTIIPPTSNSDGTMTKVTNLTMQVPQTLPISGSVTVQQQPQQHLLFSTAANSSNSNQSNQSAGNQHICNIQLPQRVTDFDAVSDQQLLQQQQQEQQQEIERLTQLTQLNQEQLQLHSQLQLQAAPQSQIIQQLTSQGAESQLNSSQQVMVPKSALFTVRGANGAGGDVVAGQSAGTVLYQSPQNQTLVYASSTPTLQNLPDGVALVNIVTSQPNNMSTSQMAGVTAPAQSQYITIPISQIANNPMLQQVINGQDLLKKNR